MSTVTPTVNLMMSPQSFDKKRQTLVRDELEIESRRCGINDGSYN